MLLEGLEIEVCKQVKSVGCRAQRNSKLNWEFMIKARNVKWGNGVADVSGPCPGDPINS